ncbi:MAG: rhomboid family intramembrane serine protease [Gammaproteobacteria bacterium]|nr:rhomboid family intramembrane serine protease [Gammaproteobacteria bacterium]
MRVIETSIDEDLSLFSQYLWQQRITHRVYEERGRQVLELAEPDDEEAVRSAYAALSDGRLVLEALPRVGRSYQILRMLRRYPGLVALIGIAVVLYPFTAPLAEGRLTAVAAGLTIVDLGSLSQVAPGFVELLAGLQVWRWFLPVFIHFSLLHLVFNCAIVIDLGRRLEHEFGAWRLLLVAVILGMVSNLGQYAMNPNPVFGGLSGVAYGLFGFTLVMARLIPERSIWQLPPGLSGSLLFFLVLFSTGVTEGFGLFVANSAHWFGLVTGAAMALVCARVVRAGH